MISGVCRGVCLLDFPRAVKSHFLIRYLTGLRGSVMGLALLTELPFIS